MCVLLNKNTRVVPPLRRGGGERKKRRGAAVARQGAGGAGRGASARHQPSQPGAERGSEGARGWGSGGLGGGEGWGGGGRAQGVVGGFAKPAMNLLQTKSRMVEWERVAVFESMRRRGVLGSMFQEDTARKFTTAFHPPGKGHPFPLQFNKGMFSGTFCHLIWWILHETCRSRG